MAAPGRPATSRSAGPPTNTSRIHADRAEFRRRDGDVETRWPSRVAPDHDAEVRLVTLDQPRRSAPRARPDQLRRGVPEPPPRGPGPPGLREAVPGDGVRPPVRMPCCAAGGPGPRTRSRSGPSRSPRRTARWSTRPTALGSWAAAGRRPIPAALDRGARLSGTVGPGAGPGLQPAAADPPGPGGDGQRRVRHRGGRDPGGRPSPWPRRFRSLAVAESSMASPRATTARRAAGPDAGRRRPVQPTGGVPSSSRPGLAVAGRRRRQPSGSAGALAARHLRRPCRSCWSASSAPATDAGPPARAVARLRPPPRALDLDLVLLDDERPGDAAPSSSRLACRRPRRPAARQGRVACSSWPRRAGSGGRRGPPEAAARVVLGGGRWRAGPAARAASRSPSSSRRCPSRDRLSGTVPRPARAAAPPEGLLFWNGLGGFTPDGREYVITFDAGRRCRRPRGPTCSPTPASAAW